MEELRIKKETDISDELALRLVLSVIRANYCPVTIFEVEGEQYKVFYNGKGKTKMFKIWKKEN